MMVVSILIILLIVSFITKIKSSRELSKLEYEEWMESRGYIKVTLELFSDEKFSRDNYIVTDDSFVCFMHMGIYSFVALKSNTFTEISVYPENPDFNSIKETKVITINTGCIKNIQKM